MPRPKIENPKDYILPIRLNADEREKLEHICDCTAMNRAEVIRCLVEGCYRNIKLSE